MTATDELRRMLDERGVKHFDTVGITEWDGANGRICRSYARPDPMTVDVTMIAVPPEQAIEATLGRGTCEMQRFESGTNMTRFGWRCTECGMTSIGFGRPNYCSNCGAKVVD